MVLAVRALHEDTTTANIAIRDFPIARRTLLGFLGSLLLR